MARNSIGIRVAYNTDDWTVTLMAKRGDEELGARTYAWDDLPEDMQCKAGLYGINKVLTDRTSDQKDKLAKLDEMDTVFGLLQQGIWARERQVGGTVVSADVEALAAIKTGGDIPAAQAALKNYDKGARKRILGSKAVQEKAKEITAKRKAQEDKEQVNLDDLDSKAEESETEAAA